MTRPLHLRFVVEASESGSRIDVVVARRSGEGRSRIADAARSSSIGLNGRPVKGSAIVAEGDEVEAEIELPEEITVRPEALPIDVVYEDDTLIVVNKPAGMVTHPAPGTRDGTLVNALLAHVGALPGDPLRAGLVHRLDRDTSGLLLVAKTLEALGTLGRAMQKRYITREYLGLVVGTPPDDAGRLEGAIGRDPRDRMRYAVRSDGKPAVTHFVLHERLHGATELRFTLETGRTHQIRVHVAAYGNAIVNDVVYGRRDGRSPLPGQALHAWRLAFKHPVTKQHLAFERLPPPAYVQTKELFSR